MSEQAKTCRNCGHRSWGNCMLSGYHCATERKVPTVCGIKFDGWIPRPGLLIRIRDALIEKGNK